MSANSSVLRRYTFKFYPNKAQEDALHQQRRMCCDLWNALLQMREDSWRRQSQVAKEHRRVPTAFDQAKEITKLRAACPEWKVMSADSQALVAKMLDEAFKAFFRRAKGGAGASSGYPRYKAAKLWETIPFREMGKGWKIENGLCAAGAQAQSGPNSRGCASIRSGHPEDAGHAQALALVMIWDRRSGHPEDAGHAQVVSSHSEEAPGSGHPANAGHAQACGGAVPCGGSGHPASARTWRIYAKGVPGLIRARGALPRMPISWRNANVIFRDGSWWLSVCVELEPVRRAGHEPLKVHFDLLDEFARVERVDGGMSPPRESANQTVDEGVNSASDAVGPESRSDDRTVPFGPEEDSDAEGPESRSHDRLFVNDPFAASDSVGPEPRLRVIQSDLARARQMSERADVLKSDRDTRFRKRSWRWREATRRAGALTLRAARIRKHALHTWTSSLASRAASLEVIAPPVRDVTKSARGTERNHGAAVEINAALNRNTLNQAPATAIQMLSYKAAEAAIPFALIEDEAPVLSIGQDLSKATKAARRARRTIKDDAA